MPEKIIDSHFHSLNVQEKGNDAKLAMEFLAGGIDIGTCCDDLPRRYEFVKDFPHIRLSSAMGPWEVDGKTIEQLDSEFVTLKENIAKYNPLFIGEAGLDYHYMYGTVEIQKYLFEKHLALAKELNKRILIHNRESDNDTADLIKKYPVTGVIHCFSGDENLMKTAVNLGYYISFAGNLTYKNNQNLRDVLKLVPRDRILLETDAPYLAPSKMRGQANTPLYITYTYDCAAEVLGISPDELKNTVFENFERFCTSVTY